MTKLNFFMPFCVNYALGSEFNGNGDCIIRRKLPFHGFRWMYSFITANCRVGSGPNVSGDSVI